MRAIKQDDVIDVIYDSWYGLPLDEAEKAVWDYAHRKLIPIEWLKSWAMKNWVKSKKCEFDIIVSKLIDDWLEKENETEID